MYAALDPVDFRRYFDGLVVIARDQLGLDALRSGVVLFVNRDACLPVPAHLLQRPGRRAETFSLRG